ncbi:hypothetical protein ACIBM4_34255 [Streptomyces sp. NPDC050256]|uniref:hypothetical protein n=1 Tax=Streptomyces sp. NPDC050256 TaxID=3365607 RepID=UPI0037A001A4
MTATTETRSSRPRATVFSSSGHRVARVDIFSEKVRVTPASGLGEGVELGVQGLPGGWQRVRSRG